MSIKLLCFALLKYILPLHADIFIVNKEHSPLSEEETDASFQEMQSEQAVKNVMKKLQVMSLLFLIKFYKWKSDHNVVCEE